MRKLRPTQQRVVSFLFGCVLLIALAGCGVKDAAAPKLRSVGEIDAQMQTVQNDANMPAPAKSAVLTNLQKEKDAAVKAEGAK